MKRGAKKFNSIVAFQVIILTTLFIVCYPDRDEQQ